MTKESYEVTRVSIHVGLAILAVMVALWHRRKQCSVPWRATLTLGLATVVFLESAVIPVWCRIVDSQVPIRDEGLAITIRHVFFMGPLALLAALLSVLQKEVRKPGLVLALSFVFLSPLFFLFGG